MTRVPPTDHSRDPLAGVERVLVDGNNLLGAMARGGSRQPPAALIGRLRAAIPIETTIELVFDGPADRGTRGERIARGLTVRYGGRFSADTVLVTLVEEASGGDPLAADRLLVVSDDRELRAALRRRGARTAGAAWLIGRLERQRASGRAGGQSIGQGRPSGARPTASPARSDDDAVGERRPWTPGRGATTKRGNARRPPKSGRPEGEPRRRREPRG